MSVPGMTRELRVDLETIERFEQAVSLHEAARERLEEALRKERAARAQKSKLLAQQAVKEALDELRYRVDTMQSASVDLACACYWRGYGEGSGIVRDPDIGPHQAKVLAVADTLRALSDAIRAAEEKRSNAEKETTP